MKMLLFNERFLNFLFHTGNWHNPDIPNHKYMCWINEKWKEWLKKEGRPVNDCISLADHRNFDSWLQSIPRSIIFVDEKDAADVPELEIGKRYTGRNYDGELVDVYDGEELIGTYCIERFEPA